MKSQIPNAERWPNFFIVGAPKCGTSSLHAALATHPDVFMPALKEPHFFGEDHQRLHHERLTLDAYLALFASAGQRARVGEASTSYLHSATAAQEIRKFAPEARIIVMLRNPVEVMYAYHATNLAAGFETIFDFEQALAAEAERRAGRQLPPSRPGLRESLYYREVATFSPQVERFISEFGRDAVKVILFDDWVADPAAVYDEIAVFLGVDRGHRPHLEVANPNRNVRSRTAHRLLHQPSAPVRRLAAVVPQAWRARVGYAVSRMNTRVGARPPLGPELRSALQAEFLPEIERLGRVVHRDLSRWVSQS